MSRGRSLSCLFLVSSICASSAYAGSIPITGDAAKGDAPLGGIEHLHFVGPDLDIGSSLFFGFGFNLFCKVNAICDLSLFCVWMLHSEVHRVRVVA